MEYIDTNNTPQCQSCKNDKVTCNGTYPCHRCDKNGTGDQCSLKEEKRGTKRTLEEKELTRVFELNFKKKKGPKKKKKKKLIF